MGRYYICKLVGKGTDDDPSRPYLSQYPVNWVRVGQVDKGSLCYVSNPIPELETDPKILPLPTDLDAFLTHNEWAKISTKFKDYGLGPKDYDPARTVRDTIIWIGKEYEPAFDIKHFRVL